MIAFRILRRAAGRVRRAFKADYVRHEGAILPLINNRRCGTAYVDDAVYLRTADEEAARLFDECGLSPGGRVLDIGCGQGRLAIGLRRRPEPVSYVGVDVSPEVVRWCRKHLAGAGPAGGTFRFTTSSTKNERYNRGPAAVAAPDLPADDAPYDVAYLYSVFSHMTDEDFLAHLRAIRTILAPDGRLFFTTWVERDVPPFEVNPPGYIFERFDGPLHVVRYERSHLEGLVKTAGFRVESLRQGQEVDGQSGILLAPAASDGAAESTAARGASG